VNECPKCGCRDFSKGIQVGHATVRPENFHIFSTSSELIHIFCLECGFILESYIKDPKKFRPKKY
jgi:predicted nucleic-acid-binding Zn-ribbon protein